MIGTSDQPCWLAEACLDLLFLLCVKKQHPYLNLGQIWLLRLWQLVLYDQACGAPWNRHVAADMAYSCTHDHQALPVAKITDWHINLDHSQACRLCSSIATWQSSGARCKVGVVR